MIEDDLKEEIKEEMEGHSAAEEGILLDERQAFCKTGFWPLLVLTRACHVKHCFRRQTVNKGLGLKEMVHC